MKALLPERDPKGNKGSFGKALVYAGSEYMSGAAVLSARAALRCGLGHVTICSERCVLERTAIMLPDAVLMSDEETPDFSAYASVVCGCGIGMKENGIKKLEVLLSFKKGSHSKESVFIVDADALNLLAKKLDDGNINGIESRAESLVKLLPEHTVLTPHKKEASRLFGVPMEELDLPELAKHLSDRSLIFLLKDAISIVAGRGEIAEIKSGTSALATAGSGDVLSGIIAAFAAQKGGVDALFNRVRLAAHVHGLAGVLASEEYGKRGVLASDLPEYAARAILRIEKNSLTY